MKSMVSGIGKGGQLNLNPKTNRGETQWNRWSRNYIHRRTVVNPRAPTATTSAKSRRVSNLKTPTSTSKNRRADSSAALDEGPALLTSHKSSREESRLCWVLVSTHSQCSARFEGGSEIRGHFSTTLLSTEIPRSILDSPSYIPQRQTYRQWQIT